MNITRSRVVAGVASCQEAEEFIAALEAERDKAKEELKVAMIFTNNNEVAKLRDVRDAALMVEEDGYTMSGRLGDALEPYR